MSEGHGTYFTRDGSKAEFSQALETWVPIAHQQLKETARTYNRTTTYKEITEHVQTRSGIRTNMLISNWSGTLLERVAAASAKSGEPPLTSLCVHQDGTIGEGYAQAPKSVPHDPSLPVDELAALHRLWCYQRYAQDLPPDGGAPTLTPPLQAKQRAAMASEKEPDICPIHFMARSGTGVCDECE